jgi:23S rRNA (adenine2030-N6)-methyltransferase
MFSYQHGYHAGGFADVHKHTALCLLVEALKQKPAPFCYLDTHAGRGVYELTAAQAGRTGEWQRGIGRAYPCEPANETLRRYLDLVRGFNADDTLAVYPGSPAIVARLARADDRLVLVEAHPAEHAALRAAFRRDRRVHIHKRDGFEALPALVPPRERRGLVLVDPSYEVKADYLAVPEMVGATLRRWSGAIVAIWYPLLPDGRHAPLVAGFAALGRPVLFAELTGPPRARGLFGTGLALVNPPWRFAAAFAAAGDKMAALLFGDAGRHAQRLAGPLP